MGKSQMLPSVLQTILLSTLATIATHHLMKNVEDITTNSEVFSNYTKAIGMQEPNKTFDGVAYMLRLNGTSNPMNATHNSTMWVTESRNATENAKSNDSQKKPKSFYFNSLPKSIVVSTVLAVIGYYWQMWLERAFPGRHRPVEFPPEKSPGSFTNEADEQREEAIVQKWIAQGKVKRASLNWWNTFVKWMLDMSLGTLWIQVVNFLVDDVLLDWSIKDFHKDKRWWLKWEILLRCLFSFLDLRPITSLVALIVVPAHKRIVFLAGAELVWTTCFGLLVGRILPMIERNETFRGALQNMTKAANEQREAADRKAVVLETESRMGDEL